MHSFIYSLRDDDNDNVLEERQIYTYIVGYREYGVSVVIVYIGSCFRGINMSSNCRDRKMPRYICK